LIGESESIRREFKSGRMFDGNQESKWIEQLSVEVSAFANTEGGELFLGIDEDRKSKPRVATNIDGVSTTLAPERLQQLIEGNISPYLPGIWVNRVRLANRPDRVVFVVKIPQGNTAYQANDKRYYGRSEFEAKALPDHEVRLRMSRGKVARSAVDVRVLKLTLGAEEERRIGRENSAAIQEFKKQREMGLLEDIDPLQWALLEGRVSETMERLLFVHQQLSSPRRARSNLMEAK
jgi:predicted HTH transcriptional regulator